MKTMKNSLCDELKKKNSVSLQWQSESFKTEVTKYKSFFCDGLLYEQNYVLMKITALNYVYSLFVQTKLQIMQIFHQLFLCISQIMSYQQLCVLTQTSRRVQAILLCAMSNQLIRWMIQRKALQESSSNRKISETLFSFSGDSILP